MQEQLYSIYSASIDFCHEFEEKFYILLKQAGLKKRIRKSKMEVAEMLTIQLYFHISGFSNFKHYYTQHICKYFTDHFFLVSYQQFNKTMNQFTWLLDLFLQTRMEKEAERDIDMRPCGLYAGEDEDVVLNCFRGTWLLWVIPPLRSGRLL